MKLEDTVKGFAEILDGKHDDLSEQAFYMVGTIDDAVAKRPRRPTAEPVAASAYGWRRLEVSLVTPDGSVFDGEAEMLIVPGADGEIGVLARHAPLVALLKAGSTRVHVQRGQDVREFATGPGFFKVEQDRALALVDDAVDVDEIDRDARQAQLEAAQAELARVEAGESDADRWQLEQRIKHAENQLTVANGDDSPRSAPPRPARGLDQGLSP